MVVLVLTVGIAAVATAFSFLDATFLRPLPYPSAERLVALNEPEGQIEHFNRVSVSAFEALRSDEEVFAQIEGYHTPLRYRLAAGEQATFATGVMGTPGFLSIFGQPPLHGSLPPTGEIARDIVVLGHSVWQESFEGSPNAIGDTIFLNDEPVEVAAVMPRGFAFPGSEDFWILAPDHRATGSSDHLYVVALLAEGWSAADARARLEAGAERAPSLSTGNLPALEIRDEVIDRRRGMARLPWIVFGAGVILLLLVATNASSLVMVWHLERRGEWAVRAALGASRLQLVRKGLLECAVLGVLAGVLGLLVAWVVMGILARSLADTLPYWIVLQLDVRILLFALVACLATVLLAGLAPSLRLGDLPLAETLKGTGKGLTGTKGEHRLRRGLIATQVAASTVLLAGSILLLGTAERLDRVEPRSPVQEILEVSFDHSDELQASARAAAEQMTSNVREALTIEGVSGASHAGRFDILRSEVGLDEALDDAESLPFGVSPWVVGRDYFDVLGLEVVEGRGFTDSDTSTEPAVGVVTSAAARAIWPDGSAVGQYLSLSTSGEGPFIQVVGVVSDRNQVLTGRDGIRVEPVEEVYLSALQALPRRSLLFVRTEGPSSELASAVAARLDALDPRQTVADATSLHERFSIAADISWALGRVFLALAVAGLVVSALGLFGLVAHGVAVRRREIGIRLAVGADPRKVVRLMTFQGLRPTIKGAIVGLVLSLGVTPLLGLFTYEVRLWNPRLLLLLLGAVMLVGWLASWLPARRAAGIAPAEVLAE